MQKLSPKQTIDPDPISPVSSSFLLIDKDIQQCGQANMRSSDRGISGNTRRKSKHLKYTNDAENISNSSSNSKDDESEESNVSLSNNFQKRLSNPLTYSHENHGQKNYDSHNDPDSMRDES